MSDSDAAVGEGKVDPAVVAALYAQHGEELRRFLYGVLRDWQLAHDVAHTAFARLVEQVADTREETRKAWLFRVAYHEALALRRRQATGERVLRQVAQTSETFAAAEDPLQRGEQLEQLRQALADLPAEQRQVVQLRVFDGKPFAQIARELGIPLGTALGRMHGALKKLRRALERDET